MGRGQVVLVLVLLVGGCAAQVTPGSLTAPATAYVVYFKNGSVIGTFESLEQCQWGRGNDLRVRTQVVAHRLGLTYERTQELLEAEMSPCTPAQATQSTAALANYWIATVKLSGPATVLVGGPTEIECLDLVGDLTCRPVKIERR